MNILTFDHFLNKDLFTKVKKEFLQGDHEHKHLRSADEDIEVNIEKDQITVFIEKVISIRKVKNGDEIDEVYDTKVQEKVLNFYDDYLLPRIAELEGAYKKSYVRNIQERNIFSQGALKGFSQQYLNKLNKELINIKCAAHLSEEVKSTLVNSVNSIYEFISVGYYQKSIEIPKKIPFTFSKNQVITLYQLLYENEYISPEEIKSTDLFRLIEETALYYDTKENSFKDINRARKLSLELFGPIPSKSSQNTIMELKEILSDPDFYNSL